MVKLSEMVKMIRRDFTADLLDEKMVSRSPFVQFRKWLQEAFDAGVMEPNAMTLATATKGGIVDARVVLLRNLDKTGFTFFTNFKSLKGRTIRLNRNVCLNFFWPELQRQVRVRGIAEKLPAAVADAYYKTRPRESQLGAWASHQSNVLMDRKELETRFEAYKKEFGNSKVPRPSHWGGYRVKPVYMEFWQGRSNRLHDRIVYQKSRSGKWTILRLNP